jgi:flavorubredoxin
LTADPPPAPPRQSPLEVARDTFVIRTAVPSVAGSFTNMNSMVIAGAEPVLVDTGMAMHRETWFADVFSLVAPEAVRWIFVTHLDADHAGNVPEALARCPNAVVVTSQGEAYRTGATLGVPAERMRVLQAGEGLEVEGRTLHVMRPPVYDSPYTRALFDPATRVYYASDAFCAPMPRGLVDWSDEIPGPLWAKGMTSFHHHTVCPWISLADPVRFRRDVDALASLDPAVIVSAHGPAIRERSVPESLARMAALPVTTPVPLEQAAA